MAGTKFSKRNLNRFRKAYPFIREEPINSYLSTESVTLEVGKVTFNDTDSMSFVLTENFSSVPTVTAVSVDSLSNNSANVNIFVTSVTTTGITFKSSQAFSGDVHFHAILIGS